ncbi:MAG: ATP/GTP-binding protein [Promethearchaeota archaeon]
MTCLLILGPAGSGKTTLVKAFSRFLKKHYPSSRVITCNLDPGSEDSFNWDINIRKIFTTSQIMKKFGLGPNGAIIKSYELLSGEILNLFSSVGLENVEFMLIDAPGQLEPLIFTEFGNDFLRALKENLQDVIGLFLMPATIINDPASYAFLLMVLCGLHLKIDIPLVHIISKADLLKVDVPRYLDDGDSLKKQIIDSKVGELSEFTIRGIEMIQELLPAINLVKISIDQDSIKGMEDLLSLIDEIHCSCGDLT